MKQFFKTFFASLLALIIFSVLGIVILASIAAGFSNEEQKVTAANSVLVIDIAEDFVEQTKSDAFSEILRQRKGKSPSLTQLIGLIQHAKKDTAIKGIYIKCGQNPNGYAASEEIRTALLDFRNSNKFTLCKHSSTFLIFIWLSSSPNAIFFNILSLVKKNF